MKKDGLTNVKNGEEFPDSAILAAAKILKLKASEKNEFRDRLNWVKNVLDRMPPSKQKTNALIVNKYAIASRRKIQKTIALLKCLEAEIESGSGMGSKEGIVTSQIRELSKVDKTLSSGLIGWDWPRPFDDDLAQAISALKKIEQHFDSVVITTRKSVPKSGTAKPGKDRSDRLIIQLCQIYFDFTGKKPVAWDAGSWSPNPGKIYGSVIQYLQILLPHIHYSFSTSDVALQEKLERMSKSLKYKDIWPK